LFQKRLIPNSYVSENFPNAQANLVQLGGLILTTYWGYANNLMRIQSGRKSIKE